MTNQVIENGVRIYSSFRINLVLVFLILAGQSVFAQSTFHRISQFEAGYMSGGSGDYYFFVFNHGFAATISHGVAWRSFSLLGGSGFYKLERSSLFPIYIEPCTVLGKKKRGHFRLRTGYALAQSRGPVDAQEYHLKGGWLVAPAYGLQMIRRERSGLMAWIGYYYQNTTLEFHPFRGGKTIRSLQNYHMAFIKLSWTFSHTDRNNNKNYESDIFD